ncbi:hypothetical protein D9M70_391890 [compost metagenome]
MGGDDADALGAVHGAAATHGDYHVAAHAAVDLGALHHLLHAGVGRYLGVEAIVDALGLEARLHIGDPAGGLHAGVGHHQHLARAEGAGVVADIVPTTGTENDLGRNELAKQADIVTHQSALSCSYGVSRTQPTVFVGHFNQTLAATPHCWRWGLSLWGRFQSLSRPKACHRTLWGNFVALSE